MDATVPWDRLVALIEPFYYADRPGKRGRKAKPIETMLRMYLLQVWFSLSDEGVEEAIYDSYAMRLFMGLDFAVEQVPDATTLLGFRHLLEKHQLGQQPLAELVLLQQMTKPQQRCRIRHLLDREVQPHEPAHRIRVVDPDSSRGAGCCDVER